MASSCRRQAGGEGIEMRLLFLESKVVPSHSVHITQRSFDKSLPDWRKKTLCANGGINFDNWRISEKDTLDVDARNVCKVCLRILTHRGYVLNWKGSSDEFPEVDPMQTYPTYPQEWGVD